MGLTEELGFIKDFVRENRFGQDEDFSVGSAKECFDPEDVNEGKALALLSYVPILCFIPFIQSRKSNKFTYEHAKQGVILFLFEMIAILGALFWKSALFLAALASIVGFFYVLNGKSFRIPLIGRIADSIDSGSSRDESK